MKATLKKTFRFEAAHYLPKVPEGHQCRRMHGHSFEIEVAVRGEVNPETGWVLDYGDITKAVKPVIGSLDHQTLNEIEGLENPTSELLAVWLWDRLATRIPGLYRITIDETCRSRCEYEGVGN